VRYDRYNILVGSFERRGNVIDRCKREENEGCPRNDLAVLTKYVFWPFTQIRGSNTGNARIK